MAAAIPLHRSTSRPCHSPLLSAAEKPGIPVENPHWTKPFCLTESKVWPACAPAVNENRAATRAIGFQILRICISPSVVGLSGDPVQEDITGGLTRGIPGNPGVRSKCNRCNRYANCNQI